MAKTPVKQWRQQLAADTVSAAAIGCKLSLLGDDSIIMEFKKISLIMTAALLLLVASAEPGLRLDVEICRVLPLCLILMNALTLGARDAHRRALVQTGAYRQQQTAAVDAMWIVFMAMVPAVLYYLLNSGVMPGSPTGFEDWTSAGVLTVAAVVAVFVGLIRVTRGKLPNVVCLAPVGLTAAMMRLAPAILPGEYLGILAEVRISLVAFQAGLMILLEIVRRHLCAFGREKLGRALEIPPVAIMIWLAGPGDSGMFNVLCLVTAVCAAVGMMCMSNLKLERDGALLKEIPFGFLGALVLVAVPGYNAIGSGRFEGSVFDMVFVPLACCAILLELARSERRYDGEQTSVLTVSVTGLMLLIGGVLLVMQENAVPAGELEMMVGRMKVFCLSGGILVLMDAKQDARVVLLEILLILGGLLVFFAGMFERPVDAFMIFCGPALLLCLPEWVKVVKACRGMLKR